MKKPFTKLSQRCHRGHLRICLRRETNAFAFLSEANENYNLTIFEAKLYVRKKMVACHVTTMRAMRKHYSTTAEYRYTESLPQTLTGNTWNKNLEEGICFCKELLRRMTVAMATNQTYL